MKDYKNYVIIILSLLLVFFVYSYYSDVSETTPRPKLKHNSRVEDSLKSVNQNLLYKIDSLEFKVDSLNNEFQSIDDGIVKRNEERKRIYNEIMDSKADTAFLRIVSFIEGDSAR